MAHWKWLGRDRHERWCRGHDTATSEQALAERLREEGVTLLQASRYWLRAAQPRPVEVAWLLRQWATLLEAGIPLLGSLEVFADSLKSRALGPIVAALTRQMESGVPLSLALSRHACFDAGLCQAVAAGEQTGRLAQALELWAGMQEKKRRLHLRVRAALLYPCLVLAMALLMLVLMLFVVVPVFGETFAAAGHTLPPATRALLALAASLHAPVTWLLLLGLFLALIGLRRHPPLLFWRDRLLLRLPLIGRVLQDAAQARWSRQLALLLAAGVPLLEAIDPACRGSGNRAMAATAGSVRRRLQDGASLHEAMASCVLFSPLLRQLVRVGETSGALDRLCERAAEHFEQETEQSLHMLTAMLEPVAMALLGGLCLFLLWALYQPVFQLGEILA